MEQKTAGGLKHFFLKGAFLLNFSGWHAQLPLATSLQGDVVFENWYQKYGYTNVDCQVK